MSFSGSLFQIARSVTSPVLALSVVWVGLLAQGCSQASESSESAVITDESIDEALRAVRNCQAQARACFADAGGADCEEQLRSCLRSTLPEGGTPNAHSERESGRPPARTDAGGHSEQDDDAAPTHPLPTDAAHPSMPEAAVRALTNPVGPADGGPAVLSCVDGLRACLASDVKPSTCAEEAQGCFADLRDAGKH
jgi:hypothetical protein